MTLKAYGSLFKARNVLLLPDNVIDLTTEEKWTKNRSYPLKFLFSGV